MDHTSTATGQQESAQLTGSAQQQGQNNIDTLIQNALQAGVPPQQLLQFLQSNLQNTHAAASPSPATTIPNNTTAQQQAAQQQAASIQQQQQQAQQQHHQQQQQTQQAQTPNNNNNNNANNGTSTNSTQQQQQHSNYHNLNAFQQQLVAQHQVAAAAAAAAQQHQTNSTATPQPNQQQQLAAAQQQQHHQQLVQQAAAAAAQHNHQAHTPTQHQQLQQLAAVAAAAAAANGAGGVTTPAAQAQQGQATAGGTTVPSLAWPIFQPTVSIPFFDMATYQKVNLDVQPSSMANGMDLPLNDINTLRFFFNFGVQHARAILLRQHIQSQSGQNQPQQQLALLQAAQNAAAMATAAAAQQQQQQAQQQQQQQNQQAQQQHQQQQQQQHQHDQYLLQQNLLKAQNEFNPSGGGSSSAQPVPNLQKTSIGGSLGAGGSATDRANVAAAAAVAAFQRDMTSSMSINALQNTLAHQMAAKIGGANQAQVHHSSAAGFKPLVGGGGNDHLETLWLQNALMGGGGGSGGLAAQLRAHPALQASPHLQSAFGGANAAAAVQQLFLQQQQQIAAAHAVQQQHVQTSISDSVELIRPQAINPLNSAASIASSLHGSNNLSSSGGLYSTAGGTSVASSASQVANLSSSPKPPIPVDPAPRKSSIMPQAFQAQLGDIKQKGLSALRSPESMSDNLQKSIAAMAAAMNVNLNVPISGSATAGIKSPAGSSVAGSNVAPSPRRSPSTTGNGQPADRSSQAPTPQQSIGIAGGGNLSLAAQLSAAMLTGHNWPAHSMAGSGNLAAGGLAARSLTSGTSGIMSHSPGQQTSGHEHQQSMNVLNMLAQHHHQQQEHSMGAGLLAPELESAPNLLAATEMHYTETFKRAQGAAAYNKKNSSPRPLANAGQSSAVTMSSAEAQRQRKSGVYMLSMDSKEEDAQKKKAPGQPVDNKPVSTTVMMNYVNNVLTTAKAQLQSQGMGLCFDESGRPIDFSSRPIDPIFRKAREHLDHQRDYTRLAEPVNAMSHASSDSSVHDGSGATIGGDLGLLSRTSGCLIGISADRLKSLSSAATASSIAGGMTFNSMTAVSSHNEQHDRPESNNNPMAIKSGANSASCSNVASPSNPLAVGIAKPSPKPMSKPAKRKFGQEDSNQVIVDLQDDNDKNLNVEELSPPASNKARSNTISATTSTMSGFSGLTSSALLSAALQKQQNLAASQGVNSSNDYENLDVVVTEACNDESGLVEVVDSGKVARSIESGELLDEDHSKNEGNSRQTTEKSTSSPTNDQPLTVDDMDDGEDSSPGGKRLRIASFSSVDDGDV